MTSNEPQYIEKNPTQDPASDFELLLAQAITFVQRISGSTWTDYNLHDPGVTILEQLCFAITDLAYRTDFPIEDLLTDINGDIHRKQHAFFEKEQILTFSPVTINDFRKVILDEMDELDNVMLVPVVSEHSSDFIKGLYKILIRVNSKTAKRFKNDPVLKEHIKEKVINRYLDKRILSEDLIDVIVMEPQQVELYADITCKYNTDPENILVNIYNRLETILNPKVRVYSEKELLERGMKIEEIYCGPLLKNGFIPDSELKPIEATIDPIDLIDAILQVEGVVFVRKIGVNYENESDKGNTFELNKDCFPLLDISSFLKNVNLYADGYKLNLKRSEISDGIKSTEQFRDQDRKAFTSKNGEPTLKKGKYQSLSEYFSIQNNFPSVYGIGRDGLSSQQPDSRKAAAKQLKAYLLFFEQIHANYLAQLENICHLYSTDIDNKNQLSYFFQPLYSVPGVEDLLSAFTSDKENGVVNSWDEFVANPQNQYLKSLGAAIESHEVYIERKNRILDHLLARFNREFTTFPVVQYFNLYIQGSSEERDIFILQWKASILEDLVKIDNYKIKAFNYLTKKNSVNGFERKMAMYLYIRHNKPRKLTSVFDNKRIAMLLGQSQNILSNGLIKNNLGKEDTTIDAESDDIMNLQKVVKLIGGDTIQNQAYIFHNQKISMLKYGIHIENYKISPAPNNNEDFIIIYKSPLDQRWSIISRHPSKATALQALYKLMAYLRKLSVESEGFHVLEHVLLRPDLKQPSFGFRFCSSPSEVIFQNDQWMSFDDREKTLAQIKATSTTLENADFPAVDIQIKKEDESVWVKVSTAELKNIIDTEHTKEFRIAKAELEKLNQDKLRMFPRFELLVRLPDGTILPEDFFNMQMTIALPAWPARFQDGEFRSFTENLFRAAAPAYLRLHFKWCGISQMKQLEQDYFDWLELFKDDASYEERFKLSGAIIRWLNEITPKSKSK